MCLGVQDGSTAAAALTAEEVVSTFTYIICTCNAMDGERDGSTGE